MAWLGGWAGEPQSCSGAPAQADRAGKPHRVRMPCGFSTTKALGAGVDRSPGGKGEVRRAPHMGSVGKSRNIWAEFLAGARGMLRALEDDAAPIGGARPSNTQRQGLKSRPVGCITWDRGLGAGQQLAF